MPSSFPLVPKINSTINKLCNESWRDIVGASECDILSGRTLSGLAQFYFEFYTLLGQVDTNGIFEAAIVGHHGLTDSAVVSAKGTILVRMITSVLSIEDNSKETRLMLYMLGKNHISKGIRPWQYSIFIETLLRCIASRLGNKASNEVMGAWVNLFGFILSEMLPAAIKGQVIETEYRSNTCNAFQNNELTKEIESLEQSRAQLRRRSSSCTSGDMPK